MKVIFNDEDRGGQESVYTERSVHSVIVYHYQGVILLELTDSRGVMFYTENMTSKQAEAARAQFYQAIIANKEEMDLRLPAIIERIEQEEAIITTFPDLEAIEAVEAENKNLKEALEEVNEERAELVSGLLETNSLLVGANNHIQALLNGLRFNGTNLMDADPAQLFTIGHVLSIVCYLDIEARAFMSEVSRDERSDERATAQLKAIFKGRLLDDSRITKSISIWAANYCAHTMEAERERVAKKIKLDIEDAKDKLSDLEHRLGSIEELE